MYPRTWRTELKIWNATSIGTGSGEITVIGPWTSSSLTMVTLAAALRILMKWSMSSP